MYNVKNEVIIFSYNGAIQENRTALLANSIISQIDISTDKKFKGILISLKGTTYNEDHKNVAMLVKQLNALIQKINIPIALIDYSVALYQLLKALTKSTKVKLFKNSSAARLFLDAKAFKKGMHILVYDEDEENSKKLSKELVHYGYTVIVAKNAEDYTELIHNKHYDVIVTQSRLNMDLDSSAPHKDALSLSKNLIANLPVFMDTAVETLVSFTGLEAQKSAHSIKRFDIKMTAPVICAVMHFKGDLKGTFVLVFPKDIAITAMESLLGERVNENDMESIMDGVGEFCNTITGSTKTALSGKNVTVIFDLPRKFTSIESTLNDIGNNNGIWIDMQLAGKPFYMFITK
ncbi:chemotaxis protein CheX [bacterium]|nr:chemotaxis protein CheX [bacterium]MBU1991269.1 chemotaxis protein CheX [bacterium]